MLAALCGGGKECDEAAHLGLCYVCVPVLRGGSLAAHIVLRCPGAASHFLLSTFDARRVSFGLLVVLSSPPARRQPRRPLVQARPFPPTPPPPRPCSGTRVRSLVTRNLPHHVAPVQPPPTQPARGAAVRPHMLRPTSRPVSPVRPPAPTLGTQQSSGGALTHPTGRLTRNKRTWHS